MYVDDMGLDEARVWEQMLSGQLRGSGLTPRQREQAQWDREDVRGRIKELKA